MTVWMNSIHLAEHWGQIRLMGRGRKGKAGGGRGGRGCSLGCPTLLCWGGWVKEGRRRNAKNTPKTWGHENKATQFCWVPCRWPLQMSPLPGQCPPPPLTAPALPASGERDEKGGLTESQAIVVCLPIAQSSWVMIQPAASDPAKYISSAGLDHTASSWRPGTTRSSLWLGPWASSWPLSSVSPGSQWLIRSQTKCNCWLNPGGQFHLDRLRGLRGGKSKISSNRKPNGPSPFHGIFE